MRGRAPSPRARGEGRDEGASPPGADLRRSDSLRGPLTLASLDLSPRAGRGDNAIPFSRRDFAPEPSTHRFQIPPLTTVGPFLFLPFATESKGKRNADRRCLTTSAPAGAARALSLCPPPFPEKAFERARSPVGVPPRLSPEGLTSPLAQLRPCFLGRGLAGVTRLRLSQSSEHLTRRS